MTPQSKGFSLVEALVTVTLIGIMALIAIGQYGRVVERGEETVALNTVETLNAGVSKYSQIVGRDLQKAAGDDAVATEEVDVLRAMQWVDPTERNLGAPYVRADYSPLTSSSTDDYRAVWNGEFFELRIPGENGAGLKIDFSGGDLGKSVTFSTGFVPMSAY